MHARLRAHEQPQVAVAHREDDPSGIERTAAGLAESITQRAALPVVVNGAEAVPTVGRTGRDPGHREAAHKRPGRQEDRDRRNIGRGHHRTAGEGAGPATAWRVQWIDRRSRQQAVSAYGRCAEVAQHGLDGCGIGFLRLKGLESGHEAVPGRCAVALLAGHGRWDRCDGNGASPVPDRALVLRGCGPQHRVGFLQAAGEDLTDRARSAEALG